MSKKTDKNSSLDHLREKLLTLITQELSPLAKDLKYGESPLESKVKGKSIVLVLGNYSSGKSTLINELIGQPIQHTGQAPTDDAFTVITAPNTEQTEVEIREGQALLGDDQFPFGHLKRHGERFTAHFQLKTVPSPLLESIAIIDTPGMLDSISEKDRGYDYQQVIGDFAQLADLILVLFDPHKAGTIKESHASLRVTLPEKTVEDRVIFVLNRVDECENLEDLLRVYGTLCWNLSQMTGRKDIPRILLSYSEQHSQKSPEYLKLLPNQRQELKKAILESPKKQLDHLVSFLELHANRLAHIVEALHNATSRRRRSTLKLSFLGLLGSFSCVTLVMLYLSFVKPFGELSDSQIIFYTTGMFMGVYFLWLLLIYKVLNKAIHRRTIKNIDLLTPLESQQRKDSWQHVKKVVLSNLQSSSPSMTYLRKVMKNLDTIRLQGVQEIRKATSRAMTQLITEKRNDKNPPQN